MCVYVVHMQPGFLKLILTLGKARNFMFPDVAIHGSLVPGFVPLGSAWFRGRRAAHTRAAYTKGPGPTERYKYARRRGLVPG